MPDFPFIEPNNCPFRVNLNNPILLETPRPLSLRITIPYFQSPFVQRKYKLQTFCEEDMNEML